MRPVLNGREICDLSLVHYSTVTTRLTATLTLLFGYPQSSGTAVNHKLAGQQIHLLVFGCNRSSDTLVRYLNRLHNRSLDNLPGLLIAQGLHISGSGGQGFQALARSSGLAWTYVLMVKLVSV
jgi:hypothetical protein